MTFAFVLAMTAAVAMFWQIITNVCTTATLLLKVLPQPDQVKTIFLIPCPPHRYIVVYNLLRYASTLGISAAWQDRNGSSKMTATEVLTDAQGGTVTTKVSQEIKPGHEDK